MDNRVKPNIILIVLDCGRYDRILEPFNNQVLAPNIMRLAQEGTVFTQAISCASWTVPSHASIFTGLFPCQHGMVNHHGRNYLNTSIMTLADVLSSSGYGTLGFSNNPWVGQTTNLDKGFSHFFECWQIMPSPKRHQYWKRIKGKTLRLCGFNQTPSEKTLIYKWLKTISSSTASAPVFLFINLRDLHWPFTYKRTKLKKQLTQKAVKYVKTDLDRYNFGLFEMTANDFLVINSMYNASVSYADKHIASIEGVLNQLLNSTETTIIILSDYGENLGEHNLTSYHLCLYDTLIRVPLIIKSNQFPKGFYFNEQVQTIDLFPTILELAQVDNFESPRFMESSLLRRVTGDGIAGE